MFRNRLLMSYAQKTGRQGGVLFTAGPINTSATVRQAQMIDYGSRDSTFVTAVREVREMLLKVGGVSPTDWASIPLQGSGTMGIEAVIASVTSQEPGKKSLIVRNGAYSVRMADVASKLGFEVLTFDTEEGAEIDLVKLQDLLIKEKDNISNVGIVHCETSTGMFNPIHGVSKMVRTHCPQATIFVDAMSSFGAVDFSVADVCDVMVSSANKCIQGVPGFSVVLARKALLNECRGRSKSFTLDIVKQFDGLDKSGQFNNTPPVQAIMAFRQALEEHAAEGGNPARGDRYKSIAHFIADKMTALGFELFLDRTKPSFGYIITSYKTPTHPKWDFMDFYNRLNAKGFVIYPGKASNADTFRIGSLGDITMEDAAQLMDAVVLVLNEMGIEKLN